MTQDDAFRYDVRIRERLEKKGLLSADEIKKHLDALKDVEENAEIIPLEQPGVGRGDSSK